MESNVQPAFAIWITGLPASGKSTLASGLASQLVARGVDVAVLESDVLRKVLTRHPLYSEQERDIFYEQIVYLGVLLTQHGVPVIFDATANRRRYRDCARQRIARFMEVYVDCPLGVCIQRDPKGIYRKGLEGVSVAVPGLQIEYEVPENPELVVHGDQENPERAAERAIEELVARGYVK